MKTFAEAVPNAVNRGWLAEGADSVRRLGPSLVFGLSQVPAERASSALVAIALGMPFGRVPAFGGGNIMDLFLSRPPVCQTPGILVVPPSIRSPSWSRGIVDLVRHLRRMKWGGSFFNSWNLRVS